MHNFGKRVWLLLGLGALAVPLAAVGLAYACTGLATVSSNPGSGAPGDTVTISGKGFTPHDPSDTRTSPAEIRLDSQSGPVLATANPAGGAAGGSFSAQITVPQVAAGDHVLMVTQVGTDGRPSYGTPARQVLTVTAAPAPAPAAVPVVAPAATQAAAPAQTTPSSPSSGASSSAKKAAALKKAVAKCNRKYSAKKGKTKAGKKALSRKRASCVSKAKARNA
jgi:hypothetical protein